MPDLYTSNRLHLGCGLNTPEGWINLDGSWNARLAKYPVWRKVARALHMLPAGRIDIPWSPDIFIHDVRRPLPFASNTMDAVYASHLLEHLYFDQAMRLLQECFRVLKSHGVLRMVVPDLKSMILEYMGQKTLGDLSSEPEAASRADRLNKRLLLREPSAPSGNLRVYTALNDLHSHKWMYDADSLVIHMTSVGFRDVQQMQVHQSRIDGIENIEQEGRVINGEGMCVEGVKLV